MAGAEIFFVLVLPAVELRPNNPPKLQITPLALCKLSNVKGLENLV